MSGIAPVRDADTRRLSGMRGTAPAATKWVAFYFKDQQGLTSRAL